MNIQRKTLLFPFLLTLFLVLAAPLLLPNFRIAFFIPFLIIVIYQKSLISTLWISCFCGLVLDLISSETHFGLYACSYTLTTGMLYKQRDHFFADSISTLSLMTFFFSVLSTLILCVMMSLFRQESILSIQWVLVDLLFLPLMDSFYAFAIFVFPFYLFGKPIRKGSDYFTSK